MSNLPQLRQPGTAAFPLAAADQCVKCGLCLPHCPTYRLAGEEGESPRGRIALMQGLVTGALEPTATLTGHLDRCLSCRACEPVCPAQVPYGQLIDAARHELRTRGHRDRWRARLLRQAAPRHWLWRMAGWFARLTQRLGLGSLLPQLPRLAAPGYRRGVTQKPAGETRGRLALFLGCAADPFDARVHQAALTLLTRLGFTVDLPAAQTCCGALHWHAGDRTTARQLAHANSNAFTTDVPVLSSATGCGAHLRDYHAVLGAAGDELAARSQDVNRFLARLDWPADVTFAPCTETVAVHLPCTQRNVLRDSNSVLQLLQRIPALTVQPLLHRDCCGAAGSYLLDQPDTARQLAAATVAAIRHSGARILLSSNFGCAMHLRAACRRAGLKIEILHPLELLARQLQ